MDELQKEIALLKQENETLKERIKALETHNRKLLIELKDISPQAKEAAGKKSGRPKTKSKNTRKKGARRAAGQKGS